MGDLADYIEYGALVTLLGILIATGVVTFTVALFKKEDQNGLHDAESAEASGASASSANGP